MVVLRLVTLESDSSDSGHRSTPEVVIRPAIFAAVWDEAPRVGGALSRWDFPCPALVWQYPLNPHA